MVGPIIQVKFMLNHSIMKHVEIIYFFLVREKVESGDIIVNFIPATEQTIDILTKTLTEMSFWPCRKKLGLFSIEEDQ